MNAAERAAYERLFADSGGTDLPYLRAHLPRYLATQREFLASWPGAAGTRLLDIGAHWLHQALLYARAGFQVTALDLPFTLEHGSVQQLARQHAVRLLPNADLERPTALAACADDQFDAVLFCDILEHITFNPVGMWRQIHRVLRPGGRIVVTTPNYYALRGRALRPLRLLSGGGGGIGVERILSTPTHGHHWKEYSRREVARYFRLLSPDFRIAKARCMPDFAPAARGPVTAVARAIERLLPPLRPNLHVEVELRHKRSGIAIDPAW